MCYTNSDIIWNYLYDGKNFEKGMEVSKKCSEILEHAEGKITKMIKENGELKEESFEV